MGRPDFKSGEGRQTSLVGSTPTLFRQARSGKDLLQVRFPGKAAGREARVGELAIDDDIELARLAGLDVDRPAAAGFEPSLHTEGFGLVASSSAVMDEYRHDRVP